MATPPRKIETSTHHTEQHLLRRNDQRHVSKRAYDTTEDSSDRCR